MRFLFTTFEGGGHVPPALLVARRLRERGHDVLFVSDEANRGQAAAAGLGFESWASAPNRTRLGAVADPLEDWNRRWPPAVVHAVCEAVITGPAGRYAADTVAFIDRFRPDAVVSNELLFGTMAAAEATATPLALLTANVWCFPTRSDVPPFGPGFQPARDRFEAARERTSRRMIAGWYDRGLQPLNAAREGLRLGRLGAVLDQLRAADLILLGVSAAFDYDAHDPPAPFIYAGPLAEPPEWARATDGAGDLLDPAKPNVLVSFSTTHQGQGGAVARCIRALAELPVNGVVTLGPALRAETLPRASNVRVVAQADHDVLVPGCAAVICHGGHGTVIRPIIAGVPVVCIPTGRDQPENAARVAWAGAGVRLPRGASAGAIRRAVARVLTEPAFASRARALGNAVGAEADGGRSAADHLVRLAQRKRMV